MSVFHTRNALVLVTEHGEQPIVSTTLYSYRSHWLCLWQHRQMREWELQPTCCLLVIRETHSRCAQTRVVGLSVRLSAITNALAASNTMHILGETTGRAPCVHAVASVARGWWALHGYPVSQKMLQILHDYNRPQSLPISLDSRFSYSTIPYLLAVHSQRSLVRLESLTGAPLLFACFLWNSFVASMCLFYFWYWRLSVGVHDVSAFSSHAIFGHMHTNVSRDWRTHTLAPLTHTHTHSKIHSYAELFTVSVKFAYFLSIAWNRARLDALITLIAWIENGKAQNDLSNTLKRYSFQHLMRRSVGSDHR